MRIRKRTPASAASPGSPPSLPPLPLLQQPMFLVQEKPREEEDKEADEGQPAILAAGVRDDDDDRVRPVAAAAAATSGSRNSRSSSGTDDDVPKPEPQDAAAAAARCSRNDGKRWRCKKAAVPGYLFCDRHIAWSTRKRKPRASKPKNHGSGVLEPTTIPVPIPIQKEFAEDHHDTQRHAGVVGGF